MASTYKTVQKGSRGSSVKLLQQTLNKKGYHLSVDGIFGSKTQAAVRDYQKKNKLKLDGVVGTETWGSLMGTTTPSTTTTTKKKTKTQVQLASLEKGYKPSAEVTAAHGLYTSTAAAKPKAYKSSFSSELAKLYDTMKKRHFDYNVEDDVSYQNYARLYAKQGKAAMEDTMGEAAALTGGYGSTYAQVAGQQSYNQYLQELAKLAPEFEENAWQRYNAESEQLMDRYELLEDRQDAEYQRWQDSMSVWEREVDTAWQDYQYASQADRSNYDNQLNYFSNKAAQEQLNGTGTPASSKKTTKKTKLSSVACDSLQRSITNYLKSGNVSGANHLVTRYKDRMTPAQKKLVRNLYSKYGKKASL